MTNRKCHLHFPSLQSNLSFSMSTKRLLQSSSSGSHRFNVLSVPASSLKSNFLSPSLFSPSNSKLSVPFFHHQREDNSIDVFLNFQNPHVPSKILCEHVSGSFCAIGNSITNSCKHAFLFPVTYHVVVKTNGTISHNKSTNDIVHRFALHSSFPLHSNGNILRLNLCWFPQSNIHQQFHSSAFGFTTGVGNWYCQFRWSDE